MKKVNPKIVQLEEQVKDLENRWKRALADYDNLLKRIDREKTEFMQMSNAALIDKLLGVLDNLDLAVKNGQGKGVEIVLAQFNGILQSEGVSEIKALGKEYDALEMDCVEIVEGKENMVVEVVKKGYKLRDRVIRSAQVKVGGSK